jgi:antitoxin YefM
MATKIMNASKARANFLDIIKKAHRGSNKYVVTTNGAAQAIIMGVNEYESWLETVNILKDASWVKALKQAEEDVRKGRIVSFEKVFGRKKRR